MRSQSSSSGGSRPTPPCIRRSWRIRPSTPAGSTSTTSNAAWDCAREHSLPGTQDCLALSFELRELDPQRAEAACQQLGAFAVTFSDARDDAVLEPGVGE